jgi:hypothetical protein
LSHRVADEEVAEMNDIRVRVNGQERGLGEADPTWVHKLMASTARHMNGHCVDVMIRGGSVNLRLATCACGGGGGFREPNDREAEICALWSRGRLSAPSPSAAAVCEFLNALRRHFGLRAA